MRALIRMTGAATLLLALLIAGSVTHAEDTAGAAGTRSWTGWITDASCGAANANAEGKACALRCAKSGSKLVLYVDGDKQLLALDDQDEAIRHLGYPVKVTGKLEDGVIKVQKIEKKG